MLVRIAYIQRLPLHAHDGVFSRSRGLNLARCLYLHQVLVYVINKGSKLCDKYQTSSELAHINHLNRIGTRFVKTCLNDIQDFFTKKSFVKRQKLRNLTCWGPTGVNLLDFFGSNIQFHLLLSPYLCFISFLYLIYIFF